MCFESGLWPPSPVRLCRSCLRRFGDLNKNTPLDFWSMYLVDLIYLLYMMNVFNMHLLYLLYLMEYIRESRRPPGRLNGGAVGAEPPRTPL